MKNTTWLNHALCLRQTSGQLEKMREKKRDSTIFLATKESESCDEKRQLEETSATKSRKLSMMSRRYGLIVEKADLEGVTVTKTSPSVEKKPPHLQLD